jgi:parvulin-like peptidyl-prolyl isomerase
LVAAFVCTLGVGLATGALVARQRFHAAHVILSINGRPVTQDELFGRMQSAIGDRAMREIVGQELLLQFAKQKGLYPTDTEVEKHYAEIQRQPGYSLRLRVAHLSPQDIKRDVRYQIAQTKMLGTNIAVSDREVRHYYEVESDPSNPTAIYFTPETSTFAVIVTHTEAEGKRALHDLAQGVSFATAVKNYSKDLSRVNDGILSNIPRNRTPVHKMPEFEAAIFSLRIGEQLGPRKVAGQWWIIRCLDKTAAVTQPYEQVADLCRANVLAQKGIPINGRRMQAEFVEFQKRSKITSFWPNFEYAVTPK